uniref:Uncharacterized protein n=1 Tax=Apteryx owenii TaxID=8824 RepID=A0A8B9QLG4_APTOW
SVRARTTHSSPAPALHQAFITAPSSVPRWRAQSTVRAQPHVGPAPRDKQAVGQGNKKLAAFLDWSLCPQKPLGTAGEAGCASGPCWVCRDLRVGRKGRSFWGVRPLEGRGRSGMGCRAAGTECCRRGLHRLGVALAAKCRLC